MKETLTYKQFRTLNPKFAEPYQESEEKLWKEAQLALLDKLESICYGQVINGVLTGAVTEKQFKEIREMVSNG